MPTRGPPQEDSLHLTLNGILAPTPLPMGGREFIWYGGFYSCPTLGRLGLSVPGTGQLYLELVGVGLN